jgi:hypothetical protein
MSKNLTNTTGSTIELAVIGLLINASSTIAINPEDYLLLASDESISEITPFINSGDITVSDEIGTITDTQVMIDYLKYPDHAFRVRVLTQGRPYGITSSNIQEVVEELRFNNKTEHEDICVPAGKVLQVHSSVFLKELKLDGEVYIL